MAEKKNYTYQDFWEMRGRQSIWVTRNFSYRVGAYIALVAHRFGISPHILSILSGAVSIGASLIAVYGHEQGCWLGAIVLILGLQLGYAIDCSDGTLARTTGKSSGFGIMLDKLVDISSGLIFPCILAYGAGHFHFQGTPVTVRVLISILILRVVHDVMMWLKELIVYNGKRVRVDEREHTSWWRLKRLLSIYIDEPVYRFGLAVAWSVGYFWEFFIPYNIGVLILSLAYLFESKREMDRIDRATDNK